MTHHECFEAIDTILKSTRQYWHCVAFEHKTIPWQNLSQALLNMSDDDVELLESNPVKLNHFLAQFIPELSHALTLTNIECVSHDDLEFPFWLTNGVKGRKVDQLLGFVGAVSESKLPILEWCAGKGHLGRMLMFHGAPKAVSVELQPHLVKQGIELAQQHNMNIDYAELDVLGEQSAEYVCQHQHAVALHACGGLHQRLIEHAAIAKTRKLTISPCCYHLFQAHEHHYAMSDTARASAVSFSNADLKLALQETVTAGKRVSKLRNIETHWRLALDCLLDDVMDKSSYFPVPSINKAIFNQTFSDFCNWAADVKGFTLPSRIDEAHYLSLGLARKKVSQRIELVRHGFRRLIELWLVLDRCLYLEQHGFNVKLSLFCEKSVTPRNLLIQAQYSH